MKNNFTTPEQSKRLLELGVPADSADCVHTYLGIKILPEGIVYSNYDWMVADGDNRIPCWSVGRLIEIFTTCAEYYTGDNSLVFNRESVSLGNINCLISVIELAVKDKCINFSKLEE